MFIAILQLHTHWKVSLAMSCKKRVVWKIKTKGIYKFENRRKVNTGHIFKFVKESGPTPLVDEVENVEKMTNRCSHTLKF